MFVLPRCRKPFATRSAKYSVEEVAEVFKADFWRCERLHIRCGAQARPAGARPEVSKLIRALCMVVATAMRGVKALGARNQSCLQSGPWVESDMNPEAGSQSCCIASCDVDGEARQT